MMPYIESASATPAKRALRTAVVVSRHPQQHVLDTVMDEGDYDIVVVESIARAYSQIRRVIPNLVIVCLDIDDLDGYRVLSMLKLDSATSGIRVVTYTITEAAETRDTGDDLIDANEEMPRQVVTLSMN